MDKVNRALALVRQDAQEAVVPEVAKLGSLRQTHVFISGGTGFLGAWLLELIAVLNSEHDFGMRVTVFSRNAGAFAQCWPHFGKLPWINFQDGDIRYLGELPRDVDYVIHAAALSDRRLCASQPTMVAETNTAGTARILRAANLLEGVRKFLLLSSGTVYGVQPWQLDAADESFVGPMACHNVKSVYAESKRMAEVLGHCAVSETKLPLVTLRPFAFVGPYQSLQLPWAVTDFIRDSFTGGPIRIMGDGATVRSIMYGSDFAAWVLAALANGRPRETYNVGSPEPIDLGTLAGLITRSFTPVPEIHTGLGQSGHDRNRLVPDTRKAERELGVKLRVSLEESLRRTITWHRTMQNL